MKNTVNRKFIQLRQGFVGSIGVTVIALGLFALSMTEEKPSGAIELVLKNNCSASKVVKVKTGESVKEYTVQSGSMSVYVAPGAKVLDNAGKTIHTAEGKCGYKQSVVVCE